MAYRPGAAPTACATRQTCLDRRSASQGSGRLVAQPKSCHTARPAHRSWDAVERKPAGCAAGHRLGASGEIAATWRLVVWTDRLPRAADGRGPIAHVGCAAHQRSELLADQTSVAVNSAAAVALGRFRDAARDERVVGGGSENRALRRGTDSARSMGGRRLAAAVMGRAADADC